MIKKIWRFIGYSAVFSVLGAIILVAMGVSAPPVEPNTEHLSRPEALADLRKSVITNLHLVKQADTPHLIIKRSTLETVAHIWNQTPRSLKLRIDPDLDRLAFRADIPFRLFGKDWRHSSTLSAAPGPAPLQPQLRLGALPIPKVIWKLAAQYLQPFGITPVDIEQQLGNVTDLKAVNDDWLVSLRDGPIALSLLKSMAARAAPNGPLIGPKEDAMAPYWQRLQSYNMSETGSAKTHDAALLFADVFTLVKERSTPETVQQESIAALLSLSAALSPPQIVALWAPRLDGKGWRVVLSQSDAASGTAKTLIAPIWRRGRLAQRRDLSMHLAVSIALDMIAGASDMQYMGLLKEISDDAKDGTGFDPNDILANSLGQALIAEIGQAGPQKAALIADCLANRVAEVFPSEDELDYPNGPIWSQTPAKTLENNLDFKPAADALTAIFQSRIQRCMTNA